MAVNLTTRFLFKQHAGITGTANDAVIDALIDDVSALIADVCDRVFELTTYKQWLDGSGGQTMLLPQWPITVIHKVTSDTDDVLDVKFQGDGTHADVTVDATNCTLHHVDNSGDEQSTALALATYKTVATLATAIDAVSGWTTVTRGGHDNEPTLFLMPVYGADALSPDYPTLEVPDDSYNVRIVSETDRLIERTAGFAFPCGRSNVFAWYKAGYTLPVDNAEHTALATAGNVPKGLTLLVNQAIFDVYSARAHDAAMKSEKIGDYSYTRGAVESAVTIREAELQNYMKVDI